MSDPETTPDPTPQSEPAPEPKSKGGGGGFVKFLLTVIILGVIGFLVWKFVLNNEPVVPVETEPAAVAEQVAKIESSTAVDTLKDIIAESNSTINTIKNVETAKEAVPALDAITKKTAAVGGLFRDAPESLQSELQALIVDFAPGFMNKLEKVVEIPGVEDAIGADLEQLIQKFELFEL